MQADSALNEVNLRQTAGARCYRDIFDDRCRQTL